MNIMLNAFNDLLCLGLGLNTLNNLADNTNQNPQLIFNIVFIKSGGFTACIKVLSK